MYNKLQKLQNIIIMSAHTIICTYSEEGLLYLKEETFFISVNTAISLRSMWISFAITKRAEEFLYLYIIENKFKNLSIFCDSDGYK